jgi:hypothetical protein
MLTKVQEDLSAHKGPEGILNSQNLIISNALENYIIMYLSSKLYNDAKIIEMESVCKIYGRSKFMSTREKVNPERDM